MDEAWNLTGNLSSRIFNDKNFGTALIVIDVILNGFRILNCMICPYFVVRLSQTSLIHVNLKILLCYLPIGFILINFSQTLSQFLKFFNQGTTTFWLIEQFTSALYSYAFISCSLTILLILVERSLAVCKRSNYEKRGSAIGTVLLTGNIIISSSFAGLIVLSHTLASDSNSLPIQKHLRWNLLLWICFFVPSLFSLILHHYTSCQNQKFDSTILNSLSDRFQSQENKATLRVLKPILVFFVCSTLIAVILTVIFTREFVNLHHTKTLCQKLDDLIIIAMSLFFMITLMRKHRPLRKVVLRDFCFCNSHKRRAVYATTYDCPSVRAVHQTLSHFNKLEEIWNRYSKK